MITEDEISKSTRYRDLLLFDMIYSSYQDDKTLDKSYHGKLHTNMLVAMSLLNYMVDLRNDNDRDLVNSISSFAVDKLSEKLAQANPKKFSFDNECKDSYHKMIIEEVKKVYRSALFNETNEVDKVWNDPELKMDHQEVTDLYSCFSNCVDYKITYGLTRFP